MANTRYKQERTLVLKLQRLPEEKRGEFKGKVLRLRRQFEQFNVDVSEICQWIMSLRPEGGKYGSEETQPFWAFFIGREETLERDDQLAKDRRLMFDAAAGLASDESLVSHIRQQSLMDSIWAVRSLPQTQTTQKLFARMEKYCPSHRMILLKSAAEWIIARYQRGYENYKSKLKNWEEEKEKWEKENPTLTPIIREEFSSIFKHLPKTSEEKEGIIRKNPRICGWEQLKKSTNNCQYTGKKIKVGGRKYKAHAVLCERYYDFVKQYKKKANNGKKFEEEFIRNVEHYRNKKESLANWFPEVWKAYLKKLEIKEETALHHLPHCVYINKGEDCEYNKHTELCVRYKKILQSKPELQEHEKLYREWRKKYLTAPKRPSFRYPSSKNLSTPKLFGKDFFHIDFWKSVVGLRLEGLEGISEREFVNFGFAPWPKDYSVQPREEDIQSVQVNFVGSRARIGFRFQVPHLESRIGFSQDAIDELRSKKYPREAQDEDFLREVRCKLTESFTAGDPESEMRVMAVDLGSSKAAAVLYKGKKFEKGCLLDVVKLDKLYKERQKNKKKEKPGNNSKPKREFGEHAGVSQQHMARHLKSWGESASNIAKSRSMEPGSKLRSHDLRSLSLHQKGMFRDWVRLNTSRITKFAKENKVDLIVFESHRDFKLPGYEEINIEQKHRMGYLRPRQIKQKVAQKAVEEGMRVIGVPYYRSSQFCAECGADQKGRFKKKCRKCKKKSDSDINAARVLALVFWGDLVLPKREN